MPTDPHHTPTIIQPSTSQPLNKQRSRRPKRKDTEVPQPSGPTTNVADEVVNKEMDGCLVRVATTTSSLEAEQDSGGPKRQETVGDTIAQTRSENVSKLSNDPLLARGNTLQSGEDSLKLKELMALCITLQSRVLALETIKTTKANEIKIGSSRRVESSEEEGLGEEDASKQRRISDIDDDAGITLVSTHFDADTDMFGVHDLEGDEVVVETLVELKSAKPPTQAASIRPKVKGIVIHEQEQAPTPTVSLQQPSQVKVQRSSQQPSQAEVQDKGKGKMIEPEPVKKMSKKDQLRSDEEEAKRLQAEFDEEERLAREKDEANVALTEEWDDIQAKIEADHELAQRLQAEEQEELSVEEKAKLFQQLLEQRRKHFAAKSAEEKRNKPPTQAQQRKIMCTYLKNMEGKKLKDLKNKSFDSIQKMFDRAFKRVNTFVDFRTDLVEGSSKRAGEELEQESTKKQKVDEDKDTAELQSLMEVIPDEEEVAIDVVPLAIKSPSIVGWKIHKEGKKSYYQIMRADGKSQMYRIFSHMLKSFSREDLEDLYKLVKAKYESTRPVEDLDLLLWGDLKTMFEPHVEDTVWRNQQDYKVLE
ncbi:hypothetical protein Tco_1185583 [Tanacetum coccineum]